MTSTTTNTPEMSPFTELDEEIIDHDEIQAWISKPDNFQIVFSATEVVEIINRNFLMSWINSKLSLLG